MYVVVEFLDEGDDLAVVPDSWCSNRSNGLVDVSWPLCRDPLKMNKLVVNKACPMMGWKNIEPNRLAYLVCIVQCFNCMLVLFC